MAKGNEAEYLWIRLQHKRVNWSGIDKFLPILPPKKRKGDDEEAGAKAECSFEEKEIKPDERQRYFGVCFQEWVEHRWLIWNSWDW